MSIKLIFERGDNMKHNYYTPYDVPSVVQGHRPWSGEDKPNHTRQTERAAKGDTKEEIDACQDCKYDECINCLENTKQKKKRFRHIPNIPASFLPDVLSGMSYADLNKVYHVSNTTITNWKRYLGLAKEKPPKGAGTP